MASSYSDSAKTLVKQRSMEALDKFRTYTGSDSR
jgi:hypothetical protein